VTLNVPVGEIDNPEQFAVEPGPYRSVDDLLPIVNAIHATAE
jgi:hypothetical protein